MFNVFFFNDTATTEIYTLSLLDALPICCGRRGRRRPRRSPRRRGRASRGGWPAAARRRWPPAAGSARREPGDVLVRDRKSTRLNSSHANISYAVFCLKKIIPSLVQNNTH